VSEPDAPVPTARICPRGHMVLEGYLKVCPACGATLPTPTETTKPGSLSPDRPTVVVPRTIPFIIGAVILVAFGTLLNKAAERGPAEYFSYLLLAGAAVLLVLAALDAVRRSR
jgi:hypothetical protein